VIKEGTYGDKFYIIASGIAKIYSTNPDHVFEKICIAGDYFGEGALVSHIKRSASVKAVTDL